MSTLECPDCGSDLIVDGETRHCARNNTRRQPEARHCQYWEDIVRCAGCGLDITRMDPIVGNDKLPYCSIRCMEFWQC